MTKGMKKGTKPQVKTKGVGKTLLAVISVGLAAGVALVAVTDKIMKKATSSKGKENRKNVTI